MIRRPPRSTLLSLHDALPISGSSPPSPQFDFAPIRFIPMARVRWASGDSAPSDIAVEIDRKSTRLNSSHGYISYAVFCLKKKKKKKTRNGKSQKKSRHQ